MANETPLTIVGNLTADPELRWINDGIPVASFTVAATPRSFDKQQSKWVDGQALFMRCTAWRDLAENIAETLKKGMRVVAQGRLAQRSWQDQKTGQNRSFIELTVDEIGPSLRYAIAQVQRSRGNSEGGANNTGYSQQVQPPTQQQQGDDPWGSQQQFDYGNPPF